MSSFLFNLLTWFSLSLVCLGEELVGEEINMARHQFIPRLRRMAEVSNVTKSPTDIKINERVSEMEQTERKGFRSGNRKGTRRGALKNEQDQPKDALTDNASTAMTCNAVNVFYGPVKLGDRHKYATSNYQINFLPPSAWNVNNVDILGLEDAHHVLPLGGIQFHMKVKEAAMAALSDFVVTGADIQALEKAFYAYAYNSRVLYSLLLTAYRCQNIVNIVDEDGLYPSIMFNDHAFTGFTKGTLSGDSFADETAYTSLVSTTVRQNLAFSSGVSNAVWLRSYIEPILSHSRLPLKTYKFLEDLFVKPKRVQPTDFSSDPRFVVFWPDALYLQYGSGDVYSTVSTLVFSGYYTRSGSIGNDVYQFDNPTMAQFLTYIQNVVTEQVKIRSAHPEIEIMFNLLGWSSSKFNFTRDLDGKKLEIDDSFSVEKLIRSVAAMSFTIAVGSASTSHYDSSSLGDLFIDRDPQVVTRVLDNDKMLESTGTASLTWQDRIKADEAMFAYLQEKIVPISFGLTVTNYSGSSFYWNMPLANLIGAGFSSGGVFTANGFANLGDFETAVTQLTGINSQQGPVLPRGRWRLNGLAQIHDGVVTRYYATMNYFTLKTYLVPPVLAQGWANEYADSITV